jgi:hypothetical protein
LFRFLFRLLTLLSLCLAVIMAVLDATKSIALSSLQPTPLGALFFDLAPGVLEAMRQALETGPAAFLWDPVALAVLRVPGFIVFAVLAFLFYAIGRRPAARAGRFVEN